MSSSPSRDSWSWLPKGFAATRWSLIRRARSSESTGDYAVAEICRLYWQPLYAFLRSKGYPREAAQDYVQSFFAKAQAKGWLQKADQDRGRFRSFMMRLLERHAAAGKNVAKIWGGGVEHVPFDSVQAERLTDRSGKVGSLSPEDHFRRALAISLFDEALVLLRAKYAVRGESELLEELLPALEGHLVEESYDDVGARVGKRSGAVKVAVSRMRQRFRELLQLVASNALHKKPGPELDEELRDLFG